jgi:hypothetical protein
LFFILFLPLVFYSILICVTLSLSRLHLTVKTRMTSEEWAQRRRRTDARTRDLVRGGERGRERGGDRTEEKRREERRGEENREGRKGIELKRGWRELNTGREEEEIP